MMKNTTKYLIVTIFIMSVIALNIVHVFALDTAITAKPVTEPIVDTLNKLAGGPQCQSC